MTKNKIKRKYNACYRLRNKIGSDIFPRGKKIIKTANINQVLSHTEANILLKEFGYIIQTELFHD